MNGGKGRREATPETGNKKASPQAGFFLRRKPISAWLLPSSALQPGQPERPEQRRQRAWRRQQPEQPGPERLREPEQQPERQLREPERACCKQRRTEREERQRGEIVSFYVSLYR